MTRNISYDEIINQDILELLGAKDLPAPKKEVLYQKMLQTIQNRVIARIDDELSEDERQQWLTLVDSADQQKMTDFLKNKGFDLPKLMLEEALIYKTELVDLANQPAPASQQK